jgi:thiol-disulfide isomerase/thioredoxin
MKIFSRIDGLSRCGVALALLLIATLARADGGKLAPSWKLKTPQGETVSFPQDSQHRPTVLMFWPSWCPFSRALQPYVQDIWNDYRNTGVNLWTINIKEDRDPVQVLRERGLSFPLLIKGDDVALQYGLAYTPWLVVIDGSSHIVYTRPPNPPSPIDTAKEVRGVLNKLLGDHAVPLPASYPKPYDLHLKDPATLNQQLVPREVPASEWQPWLKKYLAGIAPDEAVKDLLPRGAVDDGKTAMAQARELWSTTYGEEETLRWAPYHAYRSNNRWVVLGDGVNGALGAGLILVIDADSGRVIRMVKGARKN